MVARRNFSRETGARALPESNGSPLRMATNSAQPNASCVDLLQDLLSRAQRGEVVFVAVVAQEPDGTIIDGWSSARACRPYTVIGALTYIAQKFALHNAD